jgi:hypothetical protein
MKTRAEDIADVHPNVVDEHLVFPADNKILIVDNVIRVIFSIDLKDILNTKYSETRS